MHVHGLALSYRGVRICECRQGIAVKNEKNGLSVRLSAHDDNTGKKALLCVGTVLDARLRPTVSQRGAIEIDHVRWNERKRGRRRKGNGKERKTKGAMYLFGGQTRAKVEIVIKALGSFLTEAELFEVEDCVKEMNDIGG